MDRAALLESYVGAGRGRRFRFGRHDCALWTAGWVKAATGRDLRRELGIGRYEGRHQGAALLAAAGYGSLAEACRALLPEVAVLRARPGDLALLPVAGEGAMGIVAGEHVYVLRPEGLGVIALTAAEAAFRVE